ncbi:MAG: lamin tail domain-containing protein [Halobacteriota archaeon]|nr:lamin tail domain-containing protein [Halobacteriota archaeon]
MAGEEGEEGSIADHIVISEIQIKGDGKVGHDFVEIYNPTDTEIDLNQYEGSYIRLVKRTANGVSDTTLKSWSTGGAAIIPPHGYYLWASSDIDSYPGSIGADASTTGTIAQNNAVALRRGVEDTGTIIDGVGWGTAANDLVEGSGHPNNPGDDESIQRKVNATINEDMIHGPAWDSNNNSADLFIQNFPKPTNSSTSSTKPMPPVSELSTLLSLTLGLVCMVGYFIVKKR